MRKACLSELAVHCALGCSAQWTKGARRFSSSIDAIRKLTIIALSDGRKNLNEMSLAQTPTLQCVSTQEGESSCAFVKSRKKGNRPHRDPVLMLFRMTRKLVFPAIRLGRHGVYN